tara:strand:+ start:952 stop:1269 length:318 start_codon:yes stop_codon:yes gene_type:complete
MGQRAKCSQDIKNNVAATEERDTKRGKTVRKKERKKKCEQVRGREGEGGKEEVESILCPLATVMCGMKKLLLQDQVRVRMVQLDVLCGKGANSSLRRKTAALLVS